MDSSFEKKNGQTRVPNAFIVYIGFAFIHFQFICYCDVVISRGTSIEIPFSKKRRFWLVSKLGPTNFLAFLC